MCNADISSLDISSLPKNITISYLVEEHSKKAAAAAPSDPAPSAAVADSLPPASHEWNVVMNKITGYGQTVIGCLDISPSKQANASASLAQSASSSSEASISSSAAPPSQFKTLIIPVVDESGSMSGSPTTQVRYALSRIVDLCFDHDHLLAHVVCYSDRAHAFEIDKKRPKQDILAQVALVGRGGGTSFSAAFNEIVRVCNLYRNNPQITSVSILFLTDGEDSMVSQGVGRTQLVEQFKTALKNQCNLPSASLPLTLHSIGFAREHDYNFLNALRMIGSREGAYRYADPSEDRDSLANKIGSLFQAIISVPAVPIELVSIEPPLKLLHQDGNRFWFDLTHAVHTIPPKVTFKVRENCFVETTAFPEEENDPDICSLWYSYLVDQLSEELVTLNKPDQNRNAIEFRLHCELVLRRANALVTRIGATHPSSERLNKVIDTMKAIQAGQVADERKLNDMKFEGKYGGGSGGNASSSAPAAMPIAAIAPPRPSVAVLPVSAWPVFSGTIPSVVVKPESSELHRLIATASTASIVSALDRLAPEEDGDFPSLLAAARAGRSEVVRALLPKIKNRDVRTAHGRFNAADIALLSHGYWKTFDVLVEAGVLPSVDRMLLFRTLLSNGWYESAKRLLKLTDIPIDVTADLVANAPNGDISRWLSQRSSMFVSFQTAIDQGMDELVEKKLAQLSDGSAAPQDKSFVFSFRNHVASLLERPSDSHLRIIEMLIKHDMAKVDEQFAVASQDDEEEVTWPLFAAAQNGHVALMNTLLAIDSSVAHVNLQNKKGTTALWIAACNRHVDVVFKLLKSGADPNLANHKGDGPLIPCCQKGSMNLVEMLLEAGASMETYNRNRDSPILICCRTGQAKILQLLLSRLTPEKRAHVFTVSAAIDGFDPLHASTELDKVECIKVLHSMGAKLEDRTADDNAILAGATSLHLAAFYGRAASTSTLLELGANPVATTNVGLATPLHLAVKQGHASVVRVLLANAKVKEIMNTALDLEGHVAGYYAQSESNAALYAEFFENRLANLFNSFMMYPDIKAITSAPNVPAIGSSSQPAAAEEESVQKRILRIIRDHGESLGVYSPAELLSDASIPGTNLLSQALLSGKHELAQGLMDLGANIKKPDATGVTPEFWLHFMGVTHSLPPAYVKVMLDRIHVAAQASVQDKMLLALPSATAASLMVLSSKNSVFDIILKMNDGFKARVKDQVVEELRNYAGKFSPARNDESLLGLTERLRGSRKLFSGGQDTLDGILWEAKTHVVQTIAAGETSLAPVNLLALFLYTSHPDIFAQINVVLSDWQKSGNKGAVASKAGDQTTQMWKQFVQCLYRSLTLLPPHVGEIYRTVSVPFDPKEYTIGSTISWNSFGIATREWSNLTSWTNESPKSDPKTKRGIIFIIQSKTGRRLDKYSRFPIETEVVLMPGALYTVKNLYVASIIAFGQANIRTSTYLAKDTDLEKASAGQTSIIVELEEIVASAQAHTSSVTVEPL